MLSYRAKRLYYAALSPLMRINGLVYRLLRQPRGALVSAHLGPGQHHYLPGWLNIDANAFTAKTDLWADFSTRLPLRTGSAARIYSHHVIEHMRDDLLPAHFAEMFRVLVPGGWLRVGGPNLDGAIKKYSAGDAAWFPDFPHSRASIGGRFVNFVFCANEHLSALSLSYLNELASGAGFTNIGAFIPARETGGAFADVLAHEEQNEDFDTPHTIIIEAQKPASL